MTPQHLVAAEGAKLVGYNPAQVIQGHFPGVLAVRAEVCTVLGWHKA